MAREVVFVFGSNLSGIHGAGAAKEAFDYWGAEWGVGVGRTGNAYALPTKDERLITLSLRRIVEYYQDFWLYAKQNPDIQFLLTPFGTGLAGYSVEQIRLITEYYGGPLRNVWLTGDWNV